MPYAKGMAGHAFDVGVSGGGFDNQARAVGRQPSVGVEPVPFLHPPEQRSLVYVGPGHVVSDGAAGVGLEIEHRAAPFLVGLGGANEQSAGACRPRR